MNPQDIDWLSLMVTLTVFAILIGVAGVIEHFTSKKYYDEYQDQDNWGAK